MYWNILPEKLHFFDGETTSPSDTPTRSGNPGPRRLNRRTENGNICKLLIKGFDQMEEIARFIDGKKTEWLGLELIAFTHDERYWKRLLQPAACPLLPADLPRAVHRRGGHQRAGTAGHAHLADSYERVCAWPPGTACATWCTTTLSLAPRRRTRRRCRRCAGEHPDRAEHRERNTGWRSWWRICRSLPRGFRCSQTTATAGSTRSSRTCPESSTWATPAGPGLVWSPCWAYRPRIHAYHFHNNDSIRTATTVWTTG